MYMDSRQSFEIFSIGYVRSTLKERSGAPRQSWEEAPSAQLEILSAFVEGLDGIESGQEIWILTWLHEGQRRHSQCDPAATLTTHLQACSQPVLRTGPTRLVSTEQRF
jgi:tRNA (Thr-GGU) A37 N-methylase